MKFLPSCLTAKLSPALKITVLPALINSVAAPDTVPEPSLSAVAFQPISFKAFTTSSAVTNLPFVVDAVGTPSVVVIVPVFGVNVMVSPFAATSNKLPSLDLIVKAIPFSLFSSCLLVSVAALSPVCPFNWIVLLASLWN